MSSLNAPISLKSQDPPDQSSKISTSRGFSALLARLNASVAFTSYQSGLIYMVGRGARGRLNVHQSRFAKPMGLRFEADGTLVLGTGSQILRCASGLDPKQRVNKTYDACFVPRVMYATGHLDAHDVGLGADGLPIFVNTRFNCLAHVDAVHSFAEVWRPPFISDLVDEDRCHLNGLAMEGDAPAYVTAVSASDTIDGWRDHRADGGIVIDVQRNEIICRGLSMPHSPRLYRGRLYVLNAGTGEFGYVERPTGDGEGVFRPLAFCPGFLRGLSFAGNYAFVGLSKPRYERFGGLALDARLEEAASTPWCGIQIIDLTTGHCAEWLRIDGQVAEIYDVEVLPGITCPMTISPAAPQLINFITHHSSDTATGQACADQETLT